MIKDIKVPVMPPETKTGEAFIGTLHVKNGDKVKRDDILFEVETEKVVLEVVSPDAGTIENIKVIEGQPVEPEQTIMTLNRTIIETAASNDSEQTIKSDNPNKVFLVHGHDDAALQLVARSVEKLGLEVVILHEQTSGGKTIIEKFEHFSKQTGFAIVLMTPDDVGGINSQNLAHRARQNVILELGYFTGLFGRDRVFVLKKDNVEVPSDYLGVVYTDLDNGGGWKLSLAKELIKAGLEIDSTKVVTM